MKEKTAYICSNCSFEHSKWQGQCTSCKAWNVIEEKTIQKNRATIYLDDDNKNTAPMYIHQIPSNDVKRHVLEDGELNQVFGGGVVKGSVTLIAGEPGVGKSTLLLMLALKNKLKTLYISGEESLEQIKLRAERMNVKTQEHCALSTQVDTYKMREMFKSFEPECVIVDSIQTLNSPQIEAVTGSVSQIKQCTSELIEYAKTQNVPIILIGHINKEGGIAGPKLLEHMVDTVLQFEGDRNNHFRILRTLKNRFGNTNELGLYEMRSNGLMPVSNPSELLLSPTGTTWSGVSTSVIVEGIRPILIESQALVSPSNYGTPQRSTTGYDSKRLNMLLAVLEKKCKLKFSQKDVFLNITGGLKIVDTATDLGVISAIVSSYLDKVLDAKTACVAEVGLSGELRSVGRLNQRIGEVEKIGYKRVVVSKNAKLSDVKSSLDICRFETVAEAMRFLFSSK